MISLILGLTILQGQNPVAGTGQAPAQQSGQSSPDGAQLISTMFKHYASASSLTGTIRMTQTLGSHSITLDTEIAYEAPSKYYLKQQLNSATEPKSWLVTSDGTTFSYNYPNTRRWVQGGPSGRLMEAVQPISGGPAMTYRDIYRATSLSIGDQSVPEDLAIAGQIELQAIKDQIAGITVAGTRKIGEDSVTVLTGNWREYARAPASATYAMYITEAGDLKRYERHETVAVNLPNGQSLSPQQVTTVWDVDLKVNGKPDEAVFQVVK